MHFSDLLFHYRNVFEAVVEWHSRAPRIATTDSVLSRMDLPTEILLDIVDGLDFNDICSLRLVSRRWWDFVITNDTVLFKKRCEKFGDIGLNSSYFDKLRHSHTLIEQRLDSSTFITKKPIYCQPVVLLRDPLKYDSSLITWKIADFTPPMFDITIHTEDQGSNLELDPAVSCRRNRDKRVPLNLEIPWGTVKISGDILIATSSENVQHELQLPDDERPIKVKYTRNNLLIIRTVSFLTWWLFSSDGREVSEAFRVELQNEDISFEFTHSHILILNKRDGDGFAESPHLLTCSYDSIRESGKIRFRKLVYICKDSWFNWHGPLFTELLPQYVFLHATQLWLGVGHYILWCLDLLNGDIQTYAYAKSAFVYLNSDYKQFDEKLHEEYQFISSQPCMPMSVGDSLADQDKLEALYVSLAEPRNSRGRGWWDYPY